MTRYYYRCSDCLSTVVLEEKLPVVECACGGRLELLGPVTNVGRWRRVEDRPPCDGRCTGARGPKCDCSCGGKNHGTRLLVTVERDGGVARVRLPDPEAIRRAEEYRAAIARVRQALARTFGYLYERFVAGQYVPETAYWFMRNVHTELQAISCLKTHTARMRRLAELAERVDAGKEVYEQWRKEPVE